MRVRSHRESWLAGASEIAIRAKLVCHNGRHLGIPGSYQEEYTSDQYSNYLGKLIKKVKRKQIKNLELLTVNYSLQKDWQNEFPNQDPVHFIYVIFERDTWPATLNKDKRWAPNSPITNEPSPGEFNLYYRSSDKDGNNFPYARHLFTNTLVLATANTYAGSGLVENYDIGFNTVLY